MFDKNLSLNYNPNIGMNVNSRPFDEGRIFLKYQVRCTTDEKYGFT